MKQLLDPKCVKFSITEALSLTYDFRESIKRIRGFISNLPAGQLYYRKSGKYVKFFLFCKSCETYLPKGSDMLYLMSRKRYLLLLLHALELKSMLYFPDSNNRHSTSNIFAEWKSTLNSIMELIDVYSTGNLDIARIVLTSKQYKWFSGKYIKKPFKSDNSFFTKMGVETRSKSEKNLGTAYEGFAVPYHYEEIMMLDVAQFVKTFEKQLANNGWPGDDAKYRSICYMKNGVCYWNVPTTLQTMNISGSIWRAYQPNTGKIVIYNDFRTMLADGRFIIHEHEGAVENFEYRFTASERVYVMRMSHAVGYNNLITTLESDVDNFEDIIRTEILPGLWF